MSLGERDFAGHGHIRAILAVIWGDRAPSKRAFDPGLGRPAENLWQPAQTARHFKLASAIWA